MSGPPERLSIRIPPDAAHVAAVRAFVGAVGRQIGCSEDTIDDLRTVVDGQRLVLEIEPTGTFERSPVGLDGASGVSARRALIEGLFPEAEFDAGQGVLRVGASAQDD
jgi:hypothetical protein